METGSTQGKSKENADIVPGFLATSHILVVDSVTSARTSLKANLVQMGAKLNQLHLVGTMEEARAEIKRVKPKIIFCDFVVGKESGLDLIQEQRQANGISAKECVFVLVTSNGSQSAVARAAEEDVDTFVIKPYTMLSFRKSLSEAFKAKLEPTDYTRIIDQGKEYLAAGALDEAMAQFVEAKKLDAKPTLACFYMGQTELVKEALEQADGDFRQGLSYNKIHYKCLIGLFDLLMKQKKYVEAYDVVKRLAQYFPANPKRLASVLRLAILTRNYDDIEGYYRIFTQLDQRTDELIRYTCSALAVTAKHYLVCGYRSRGVELFEKVATSCAGRMQYMRYAVETMIDSECVKDAESYLSRFPPESRGKSDYLVASLIVAGATRHSGEVIQQARNLLNSGIEQPDVYHILIRHSMKSGLKDSAETLVQTAAQKWPEQAEAFAVSLAEALPEGAAEKTTDGSAHRVAS